MKGNFKGSLIAVAVAAAIAAPAAHATNGYFKIGYGTKNRGMAGAGIAFSQDSLAPATNPSGIAWVGNRVDAGVELFNPLRDAQLDTSSDPVFGAMGGQNMDVDSGATLFAIPHAGFIFNMGNISTGLSISANGGMNTRYNTNLYAGAFGPIAAAAGFAGTFPNVDTLGVNLSQVIIAPTVAAKVAQDHSLGASLLIGYQRFRAYGLGMFQPMSADQAHVTNKGDDDAWGAGVRLGWTGNITNAITLGAQYSSKIYMQEFDRYAGLFADQGDFDIPANFGVGIAVKVNPKTTVAFDVQQIQYGDVDAIANAGPIGQQFIDAFSSVLGTGSYAGVGQLGQGNGWGFGWDDITVYKLGVNYEMNSQWTLRGGVNIGDNPIDSDQNLFNILAPGVVEKHLTLGFTYSPSSYSEISATYMHAFREEQSYTYTANMMTPGGAVPVSFNTEIGMDQNAIEISYGMKF